MISKRIIGISLTGVLVLIISFLIYYRVFEFSEEGSDIEVSFPGNSVSSPVTKEMPAGYIPDGPAFSIERKCYTGGCSGQICSDREDVFSTCDFRESYTCYKTARCERQTDGKCGWTKTSELTKCLDGFSL